MKSTHRFFWAIAILIVMALTSGNARAEIPITDQFSVAGFVRYELGVHTAEANPNLPENHNLTLSRFFLQTEWTYKPSDLFKAFANIRAQLDTTAQWDSNLDKYDAFPVDVPDDDWTMMKASEDEWRAEIWELYAEVKCSNLWVRAGRQQIAWGEMIGGRIMDIINPLDYSWNFIFEPEEFELIRIPLWSIRGIYSIRDRFVPWMSDMSIEAFVTPFDVVPNQSGDIGAPFQLAPAFPPFIHVNYKDRRGDTEYGVRIGAMLWDAYVTLNYLHLYNDDFLLDLQGIQPMPLSVDLNARYPSTDVFGLTANYFFAAFNLVTTLEARWIPDQPYSDASALNGFGVVDQGTGTWAIRFDRPTSVLPPDFLSASFMTIQLQFSEVIVEGDENDILAPGFVRQDKSTETIFLVLQQPLLHNDLTPGLQAGYDPDGAYYLKPSVKYVYGNHWYFDIWATFLGGSEDRPGRFGSLYWADSVYTRVTYQF